MDERHERFLSGIRDKGQRSDICRRSTRGSITVLETQTHYSPSNYAAIRRNSGAGTVGQTPFSTPHAPALHPCCKVGAEGDVERFAGIQKLIVGLLGVAALAQLGGELVD